MNSLLIWSAVKIVNKWICWYDCLSLSAYSWKVFMPCCLNKKRLLRKKLTPLILLPKFRGRRNWKFHLMWLRKQNMAICHKVECKKRKNELVFKMSWRFKKGESVVWIMGKLAFQCFYKRIPCKVRSNCYFLWWFTHLLLRRKYFLL